MGMPPHDAPGLPVTLPYTNHRGQRQRRTFVPQAVFCGSTQWHPTPQWMLHAWDVEKQAYRDFALAGFAEPTDAQRVSDANLLRMVAGLRAQDPEWRDLGVLLPVSILDALRPIADRMAPMVAATDTRVGPVGVPDAPPDPAAGTPAGAVEKRSLPVGAVPDTRSAVPAPAEIAGITAGVKAGTPGVSSASPVALAAGQPSAVAVDAPPTEGADPAMRSAAPTPASSADPVDINWNLARPVQFPLPEAARRAAVALAQWVQAHQDDIHRAGIYDRVAAFWNASVVLVESPRAPVCANCAQGDLPLESGVTPGKFTHVDLTTHAVLQCPRPEAEIRLALALQWLTAKVELAEAGGPHASMREHGRVLVDAVAALVPTEVTGG